MTPIAPVEDVETADEQTTPSSRAKPALSLADIGSVDVPAPPPSAKPPLSLSDIGSVDVPAPMTGTSVTGMPPALASATVGGQMTPLELETIAKSPATQAAVAPPIGTDRFGNAMTLAPQVSTAGTVPEVAEREAMEKLAEQSGFKTAATLAKHPLPLSRFGVDKESLNAWSDVMERAGRASAPLVGLGAVLSLPGTFGTLATSYLAAEAAGKGAEWAGASPEMTRFAKNVAATATALGGAHVLMDALKPMVEGAKTGARSAVLAGKLVSREGSPIGYGSDLQPVSAGGSVRNPESIVQMLEARPRAGENLETEFQSPAGTVRSDVAPPVDEAGRPLGGYAGPERRAVTGEAPGGVERRAPTAETPPGFRPDMSNAERAAALRQENPDIEAEAAAARARAAKPTPVSIEDVGSVDVPADKPLVRNPKYDYSSTQVDLPKPVAKQVLNLTKDIPREELAEDGREMEPHITVKYGLHEGVEGDRVRQIVEAEPPIRVTLGQTSVFTSKETGKDYDVLKIEVHSPDLERLNALIAAGTPNTETHADYQPHITLAYLKPGTGEKYAGDDSLQGQQITFKNLEFKGKDGTDVTIPLTGSGQGLQGLPPGATEREPRAVGGTYLDFLSGDAYRVTALTRTPSGALGTVSGVWTSGPEKGQTFTNSTKWNPGKDVVVQPPPATMAEVAPSTSYAPTKTTGKRGGYTLNDIVFEKGKVVADIVHHAEDREYPFSVRVFDGAQLVSEGTGGRTRDEALVAAKKAFDYSVRVAEQRAQISTRLGGTKVESKEPGNVQEPTGATSGVQAPPAEAPSAGAGPGSVVGGGERGTAGEGGVAEGPREGTSPGRRGLSPEDLLPEHVFTRATPEVNAARLTPRVRRELQRILDEMESYDYGSRTWTEVGDKSGNAGDYEIAAGHGGAPVYDDILSEAPMAQPKRNKDGTLKPIARKNAKERAGVIEDIRRVLQSGDIHNHIAEGAVRVAEKRDRGDWNGLSPASLPPSWKEDVPDAVDTAVDDALSTMREREPGEDDDLGEPEDFDNDLDAVRVDDDDDPKFSRREDELKPLAQALGTTEDALRTLGRAKIDVSDVRADGTVALTGRTYDQRDLIRDAGGRWNSIGKSWLLTPDRLVSLADRIGAVSGGQPGRPSTRQRDAWIGDLRIRAEERPDRRRLEQPVESYLGPGTADLLRQGLKAGLPPIVVDEQVEDVALISRAYQEQAPLFILASDPGAGKTFVLGGAIRELRRQGAQTVTYVTLRRELIDQIKGDLKDYGIGDVQFLTYPMLIDEDDTTKQIKTPPQPNDVLIFDEAHTIKNAVEGGAATAIQAKQWMAQARMTIMASATPYENVVKANYLEPTGIFRDPFETHARFAQVFGATAIKAGKHVTAIVWNRTKTSDKDAAAAREWFIKSGVYTARRTRLPEGMVDSRLVKVDVDPKDASRYATLANLAADAQGTLPGHSQMWVTNFQKRLLEASKVQTGIKEAESALADGRYPIIFVETKAERELDIPDLLKREETWALAAAQARMMRERPPTRKSFGLPPPGIPKLLGSYMTRTGEEIIRIPSAEDEIAAHFGEDKVAIFTGSVTPEQAQKHLDEWRAGTKPVLVATMAKGGAGLSLHDKVGDHPTTQININLPWTATNVVQVTGRSARWGLKSKAEIQWLFANNIPFDRKLSAKVGGRMADMGAVIHGERLARSEHIEDWNFQDIPLSERNPIVTRAELEKLAARKGTTVAVQAARARKAGYRVEGPSDEPSFARRGETPHALLATKRTAMDEAIRRAHGGTLPATITKRTPIITRHGMKMTAAEYGRWAWYFDVREEPAYAKREDQGGLFGEEQPTLPGAEEARKVGKADTTFKAPQQATGGEFTLEPEYETPEAKKRAEDEARGQKPLFSRREAPPFFSALTRAAEQLPQAKGTPEQMAAMLTKAKGVKKEELEWSGVEPWLKAQAGSVTRQQIVDYLRANELQVREVTLGAHRVDPAPWLKTIADAGYKVMGQIDDEDGEPWLEDADENSVGTYGGVYDDTVPKAVIDAFEAYRDNEITEHPSATKFNRPDLLLPGGENYRELLLTLPEKPSGFDPAKVEIKRHLRSTTQGGTSIWYDGKKIMEYGDDPALQPDGTYKQKPESYWMDVAQQLYEKGDRINRVSPKSASFHGGHFDEPNVVAHLRFNDRTTADGKKMLFVEEVQSDWHQKGRRQGYRTHVDLIPEDAAPTPALAKEFYAIEDDDWAATPQYHQSYVDEMAATRNWQRKINNDRRVGENGRVPDAPFKTTWPELAMKRAIRYAAEHGYDTLGFTTGAQQNERYDLSRHVRAIGWRKFGAAGLKRVDIEPRNDRDIVLDIDLHGGITGGPSEFHGKQIDEVVGKDIGKRIMDEDGGQLTGLQLHIGGAGMRGFYDQILPAFLNKFGKPFGARVSTATIGTNKKPRYTLARMGDEYRIFDGDKAIGPGFTSNPSASADTQAEAWLQAHRDASLIVDDEQFVGTVHAFDITPQMRATALEGLPLFARGQLEALGGGIPPELLAQAQDYDEVLRRTYHDMPTVNMGGRSVAVLDAGQRLTPEELAQITQNKDFERAVQAHLAVLDTVQRAMAPELRGGARIERTGVLFGYKSYGVYLPKPKTFHAAATILLNIPEQMREHSLMEAADKAYTTIVHELLHAKVHTDGPEFERLLAETLSSLGHVFARQQTTHILRAYEDPNRPGQYHAGLHQVLSLYSASRGRPARAVDAISREERGPARPTTVGKPTDQPAPSLRRGREGVAGETGAVAGGLLTGGLEKDVKILAQQLHGVVADAKVLLSPQTASPEAQSAADAIREAKATSFNAATIERMKYAEGVVDRIKRLVTGRQLSPIMSAIQSFNKATDDANLQSIAGYERTGQFPGVSKEYSEFYRASMGLAHNLLLSAYGEVGYIENYVRRKYVFGSEADERKGVEYLRQRTRTLAADKSVTKRRAYRDVTMVEALDDMQAKGIDVKPATTNPELLRQWTLANARQAAAFAEARRYLESRGLIEFVRIGGRPAAGLAKISDYGMAAFFPKEIGLGYYWADPTVARILNNATSLGFKSASFEAIRGLNNMLNQVQLGLSAFHATGTAINSGLVDASNGVRELAHAILTGNLRSVVHGGTAIVRSGVPLASVTRDLLKGASIVNGLKRDDPEMWRFLEEQLNPAGGRLQMEARYRTQAIAGMLDAWKHHEYARAGIRLPLAIVEATATPLMQYAIPRIKLGVFMDRAKDIKRRMPDASDVQLRRAYAAAWDQIDNIFGLLVYDNGFWNRTAQDLAQVMTRSVGWTGGSLRWGLGAVSDVLHAGQDVIGGAGGGKGGKGTGAAPEAPQGRHPFVTDRVLDAMMLPFYVGMIGAVYQYLHTKTWPKDIKHYFHPWNGRYDDDGSESLTNLPTYMKDVESYRKAPLTTLGKKMAPLPEEVWSLATNRNYWDDMIYDPHGTFGEKLQDAGKYLINENPPFSIQQWLRASEELGGAEAKAEAIAGFTKAGRDVTDTAAEKLLREYARESHAPRSPEQVEEAQTRAEFRRSLKSETPEAAAKAEEIRSSGALSRGQIRAAQKSVARRQTALEAGFKARSLEQAIEVYTVATPEERTLLLPLLRRKAHADLSTMAPTKRRALTEAYHTAANLPTSEE